MKRRFHRTGSPVLMILMVAALLSSALLPLGLGGCGDKIAIPEPTTIWANLAYSVQDTFEVVGARQLLTSWSNLFVLTDTELSKRNLELEADASVALDADPTAMCVDETGSLVFVWEQGTKTLSVFDSTELEPVGSANLVEVESVVAMATAPAGMDTTIVGGRTFLYLADEVSGLIHRYAVMGPSDDSFFCSDCLLPWGILAWPTGEGARSIHEPAGMALDSEGRLLVCEQREDRNWVLRFDSTPDETDTTPIDPEAAEPIEAWAGTAVIFGQPTCAPEPAQADYVLGNAAICNEDDWVGGPSDADGEFDHPAALAIDGSGKIFVADSGNSRVQIFDPDGTYRARFQIRGDNPLPISLGLVDDRQSGDLVHYAAYVFILTEGSDQVLKMISSEQYLAENGELPPYEE